MNTTNSNKNVEGSVPAPNPQPKPSTEPAALVSLPLSLINYALSVVFALAAAVLYLDITIWRP